MHMFFLHRYKIDGLPHGLIRLHEFLIKDIIEHFEKGKYPKKRIKKSRKAVLKAIRLAKRKKIYPSIKISQAIEMMEEVLEEIDYTHRVIKETANEMERAMTLIRQETVGNVLPLLNTARRQFRDNDFENGIELLKESKDRMKRKFLEKTRQEIFTGINSEVKKLKYEIQEKREDLTPKT